jgi:glutamine cyclotransferase
MKKGYAAATLLLLMIIVLSVSIIAISLNQGKSGVDLTPQTYGYAVVNTYPHDPNAFTEGLLYAEGFLYESTGLEGASSLRRVDLASGDVLQNISLPSQFFGEGIAIVGDNIIQLTYLSHVGFVYDKTSFALIRNFTYPTQGWGLTYNGEYLIMSDGSSTLHFLDPTTFEQVKQVQVQDGNVSVQKLNELEYVNGDVYANIFGQQKIAIINPETGQVKAWLDLTGLQNANLTGSEDVLNGIAYDSGGNRLFVTGKYWTQLYEIKLIPVSS